MQIFIITNSKQPDDLIEKCHYFFPNMPIGVISETNTTITGPALVLEDLDSIYLPVLSSTKFPLSGLTCFVDYQLNDGSNKKPFLQLTKDKYQGEVSKLTSDHHDGLAVIGAYYLGKDISLEASHLNKTPPQHIRLAPKFLTNLPKTPALFLDRDGIVNEDTEYLYHPDDLVLRPGIEQLISYYNKQNFPVICLTNQSGVARGKFSEEQVHHLHREIDKRLEKLGAKIDHYEISPFYFEKGIGHYKKHSVLRKPFPGMLLLACRRFNLDLVQSIMVGDKNSDLLYFTPMKTFIIPGKYQIEESMATIVNNFQEILNNIRI